MTRPWGAISIALQLAPKETPWVAVRPGRGPPVQKEVGVSMTKEDIVNRIWNRVNLNKKQSHEVIEFVIECIKDTLKEGEKIKIGRFGVFEVKERKARIGRNPKTGKEAEIKAGKTIKFRAGKPLKQSVEAGRK